VESILTVMALRDGVIPKTLNLRDLDPEIDLDVLAGGPRLGNYQYAVNNWFGFGGHMVANRIREVLTRASSTGM
jgi:beta-ketoacyl ACP synthase